MKKVLILAFALGACSIINASVTPKQVYVLANAFDAVEASATQYVRLDLCTGTNGPLCRSPATTAKVIVIIRDSRAIRDKLEAAVISNDQPTATTLYTALSTNIDQIKTLIQDAVK